MQRIVDSAVGVSKEFCKTLCRESFHYGINAVNSVSAMVLAFSPRREHIMEGLKGWELRPSFRAPRMPQWMEEGVSSLNDLLYDFVDAESASDSEDEIIAKNNLSHISVPSSPSPPRNHHSYRNERKRVLWLHQLKRIIYWILWPLFMLFGVRRNHRQHVEATGNNFSSDSNRSSRSSSSSSLSTHLSRASSDLSKKLNDAIDFVTHLNDNRRRGIIEDLQVVAEIAIDRIFETLRKVLYYLISPWNIIRTLFASLSFGFGHRETVQTTRLGLSSVTPAEHSVDNRNTLNSDTRTARDIITELGYPYESFKLQTDDGYILTLERIPRKDSAKVVLLQHGLLDSSIGWVSNGVVGSQAFASYDQGYDVFLGNFRGYASREHSDPNLSAQKYWQYSINEHAIYDIKAMVSKIHSLKCKELNQESSSSSLCSSSSSSSIPCFSSSLPSVPSFPSIPSPSSSIPSFPAHSSKKGERERTSNEEKGIEEHLPYHLSLVSHSMGGAASLTYVVWQRANKQPHRLSRLILLSPAGFHKNTPVLFDLLQWVVPYIDPFMVRFMPAFYIPTSALRLLFNKLTQDFQNLPAVRALVQVIFSNVFMGGDCSAWVDAMRQPHYNMFDMPGLSYRVMKHLAQMKLAKAFIMYDYGSPQLNYEKYGSPSPFDVGANYNLIDIPVDVVLGSKDRLIPPSMIMVHYHTLINAGVEASIKEFEYAHLDFTFAHKEELLAYVMSRLALASSPKPVTTAVVDDDDSGHTGGSCCGSSSSCNNEKSNHGIAGRSHSRAAGNDHDGCDAHDTLSHAVFDSGLCGHDGGDCSFGDANLGEQDSHSRDIQSLVFDRHGSLSNGCASSGVGRDCNLTRRLNRSGRFASHADPVHSFHAQASCSQIEAL